MSRDIIEKHALSDGSSAWIQRIKVPGVRRPSWTVVKTSPDGYEAPVITDCTDSEQAHERLADIIRADVLEVES